MEWLTPFVSVLFPVLVFLVRTASAVVAWRNFFGLEPRLPAPVVEAVVAEEAAEEVAAEQAAPLVAGSEPLQPELPVWEEAEEVVKPQAFVPGQPERQAPLVQLFARRTPC